MIIEELIEKYFEGETTIEQEEQIRRWFEDTPIENMPEGLKQYAPLFIAISRERAEMPEIKEVSQAKSSLRRIIWFAASGAVAAALIIGIVIGSNHPTISVQKEKMISMTIGGVEVEDGQAAKDFANEQMKKLSRIMNKNMVNQKIGVFKKMVLRADNLLNTNIEEIQEQE